MAHARKHARARVMQESAEPLVIRLLFEPIGRPGEGERSVPLSPAPISPHSHLDPHPAKTSGVPCAPRRLTVRAYSAVGGRAAGRETAGPNIGREGRRDGEAMVG